MYSSRTASHHTNPEQTTMVEYFISGTRTAPTDWRAWGLFVACGAQVLGHSVGYVLSTRRYTPPPKVYIHTRAHAHAWSPFKFRGGCCTLPLPFSAVLRRQGLEPYSTWRDLGLTYREVRYLRGRAIPRCCSISPTSTMCSGGCMYVQYFCLRQRCHACALLRMRG